MESLRRSLPKADLKSEKWVRPTDGMAGNAESVSRRKED